MFQFSLILSLTSIQLFVLLDRHEPPIDTYADLARSNVNWSATHLAWIYSILDTDNPDLMTVRDHFEVLPRDTLEELNTRGTLGYAIERLDYGYFAFGDYIAGHTLEKMRVMRGNIIDGHLTACLVRSWYLKDEFDQFILTIAQSGIQSYWLLDVTYRQLDPSVQMGLKLGSDHQMDEAVAEELRLDRMVGIFYMLALGLAIASVVFVLELLHGKYFREGEATN